MSRSVSIIGGGSASLITAERLSKHFDVTIYEKGKSIGKKYLVAGKGGFNLAHNLPKSELVKRYQPQNAFSDCISLFGVYELRDWYQSIGIPTFVGTSNRVFPKKGISPADVLRSIKTKLNEQSVTIKTENEFIGFSDHQRPLVRHKSEIQELRSDFYIFALGGGSWEVTGANSDWLTHFDRIGVSTAPFQASNCGLNISWNEQIINSHIGKPLKNIGISHNSFSIKGEAVVTQYGIEGNAIYPISPLVRGSLESESHATIQIDFKPHNTLEEVFRKVEHTKPSNYAKILQLDTVNSALIKSYTSKEEYLSPRAFSERVKSLSIPVDSLRPIEESISTVGGIEWQNLNADFSLKKYPHLFCIGEMVDWDAPTGGFLLQGCFSMGFMVAKKIAQKKPIN